MIKLFGNAIQVMKEYKNERDNVLNNNENARYEEINIERRLC